MPQPEKLDLMETGTRFDHYMELRDTFAEAIVSLENSLKVEENLTTRENIKKLTSAVNLIEARVNFLSDFNRLTTQYSAFGRTLADPQQGLDVTERARKILLLEAANAKDSGTKSSEIDKGTST